MYFLLLAAALIVSAIGFKKYVWFISIGYGFSMTAIGIVMLILFRQSLSVGTVILCILLIIYGCRLSGYLLYRELKSSAYNQKMKQEIKDGSDMKFGVKLAIWISCAFLYTCEAAPVYFRLLNGSGTDTCTIVGIVITILGIVLESSSDLQKSAAKKKNPRRFVDSGLFRIVRCPNYLGEILIWTGFFVSGVNILTGPVQWVLALIGYIGIVYIMFGGARRLELRQNRTYGEDPEYQEYVKKVPILIPLVPLYSVAKYKWLVG